MTTTLLIDIDDTLLSNPMETFIPSYLAALGKQLASYTDPKKLVAVMNTATTIMFKNNHPDRSLKEVFDPNFYPPLGITEDEVREPIAHFYREVFPTLRTVTKSRPEAVKLIETAIQRGWKIAIATNPVFPRSAILHRLTWAGVPPDQFHYVIIPSYETFHFAKPNPAFVAELLGRIGWPRGPIIMVGNHPEHDIQSAQSMGIPAFWVSNGLSYPDGLPSPSASGGLGDVIPWLDSTPEENLLPNYNLPSAIAGTMRGIPGAWNELTSDLSIRTWKHRPEATQWSLTEIACHLRDVEREINLPRLQMISREENPFIPGIDSDAWANERDYQSQDGPQALMDFVSVRMETLELLDSLTLDEWQRSVQHAIFGPTNLQEIASIIAGHDRLHNRQIYALVK